jgi:hypothetical protein
VRRSIDAIRFEDYIFAPQISKELRNMGWRNSAAVKMPNARLALITAVLVGLIAVVGVALKREMAPRQQTSAASFTAGLEFGDHHDAPALSADEERYAAALWPIHSAVKLASVRMTFAGINYKTGDHDAKKLKAKVRPLTQTFISAQERARKIQPPASLAQAHRDYLEALVLYAAASKEMVRVADDGSDEHLLAAQVDSERASTVLIKLSDALWPGEYKPN